MATTGESTTIWENNKHTLNYVIVDENGDAKNLTGLIAKFNLARIGPNGPLRTNPILDKKSPGSADIVFTDLVNGLLSVILQASDTVDLAIGGTTAYIAQLELFSAAETDPVVVAESTINFKPNVSNA